MNSNILTSLFGPFSTTLYINEHRNISCTQTNQNLDFRSRSRGIYQLKPHRNKLDHFAKCVHVLYHSTRCLVVKNPYNHNLTRVNQLAINKRLAIKFKSTCASELTALLDPVIQDIDSSEGDFT